MTVERLTAPVGLGAPNLVEDVKIVQKWLQCTENGNNLPATGELWYEGSLYTNPVNGICDAAVIQAIKEIQKSFMNNPDGVISPGGKTWQELTNPRPSYYDSAIIQVVRKKQGSPTENVPTMGELWFSGTRQMYTLECSGPSTESPNLRRRILPGVYNLDWYHYGRQNEKVPILTNKKVPYSRKILIHIGNYHENTEGCLLVGRTIGGIDRRTGRDNFGLPRTGKNTVGDSRGAFIVLKQFLQEKGIRRVKLEIIERYQS